MKTTGIIWRIDNCGRITLPTEIRQQCGISTVDRTLLEFFYDAQERTIVLKVYETDEERRDKWVKEILRKYKYDCGTRHITVKIVNNMTIVSAGGRIEISKPCNGDKFNKNVGLAIAYAKIINQPIPDFI